MSDKRICVDYYHGLGDAVHFAHSVPLWRRRGWDVSVTCPPDYEPLFAAVGAREPGGQVRYHDLPHPQGPGQPTMRDHWAGNKVAWNLTHSGCMPDIGHYSELWDELCGVRLDIAPHLPQLVLDRVRRRLDTMRRPIVAIHCRGNNVQDYKNYDDHAKVAEMLLERGCSVACISDCGVPDNEHVQRMPCRGLAELYAVVDGCNLLLGIDSGPSHFARVTNTPALIAWHYHHPSHYALPRPETLHVSAHSWQALTLRRRLHYQIVAVGDKQQPPPETVYESAMAMLQPGELDSRPAANAYLKNLVTQPHVDPNVAQMLKLLRSHCQRPTIAEVGYSESTDVVGAFVKYAEGRLTVFEPDGGRAYQAKKWTTGLGMPVEVRMEPRPGGSERFAGAVLRTKAAANLVGTIMEPLNVVVCERLDAITDMIRAGWKLHNVSHGKYASALLSRGI